MRKALINKEAPLRVSVHRGVGLRGFEKLALVDEGLRFVPKIIDLG